MGGHGRGTAVKGGVTAETLTCDPEGGGASAGGEWRESGAGWNGERCVEGEEEDDGCGVWEGTCTSGA